MGDTRINSLFWADDLVLFDGSEEKLKLMLKMMMMDSPVDFDVWVLSDENYLVSEFIVKMAD